ncbi:hypothetical protein KI387_034067, partial [Taxus chinensis]
AALFHSIKPLLTSLLLWCAIRFDLPPLETLLEEHRKLVAAMKVEAAKNMVGLYRNHSAEEGDDGVLILMSALKEKGVIVVKNATCERLLEQRVEIKMNSKKINSFLNRIHSNKLEKDIENENGGVEVFSASLKKRYVLENDEWKEDDILEIMDGNNVADFIEPDILQRLEELEGEEWIRMEAQGEDDDEMEE